MLSSFHKGNSPPPPPTPVGVLTHPGVPHTAALASGKIFTTWIEDPGLLPCPWSAQCSPTEGNSKAAPWKELFLLHPCQQPPLGLRAQQVPVFWLLWAYSISFEVLQPLGSILGHFGAAQASNNCCSLHKHMLQRNWHILDEGWAKSWSQMKWRGKVWEGTGEMLRIQKASKQKPAIMLAVMV